MRILVCGDRNWTNYDLIHKVLSNYPSTDIIVQGGARGADRMASDAALSFGMVVEEYPADWETYGKKAGPIRNQTMLNTGIDLVLAFHNYILNSRGTKDMVSRAKKANIPYVVITER